MDENEDKSREVRQPGPEPPQEPTEPIRAAAEPATGVAAAPAKDEVEEAPAKAGPVPLSERDYKRLNRREVLKLTPLVLLGAFAIPKLQHKLLEKGVALSDWASNA